MKYLVSAFFLLTLCCLCCCSFIDPGKSDPMKSPFAYCAAAGDVDVPAAPYCGPAMPPEILQGLRAALNADAVPRPVLESSSHWRCMGNKVYACFTGANIPCLAKADTTRTPDVAMLNFCTEHPESEIIPSSVTGRFTVYQWRCRKGLPEAVKQVLTPDANGFVSEYWHEIRPGGK